MANEKSLNILWTNADVDTSVHMVMMYATNAMLKGWWENITVIIWGATARLVAENALVQEKLKMAEHAGVKFSACIACARNLGVVDKLEALGLEIKPWGEPLTELLMEDRKLLTI